MNRPKPNIDKLEEKISKLEEKVKDQYLLINDRINEAFFIIKELDRKQIKDAQQKSKRPKKKETSAQR